MIYKSIQSTAEIEGYRLRLGSISVFRLQYFVIKPIGLKK